MNSRLNHVQDWLSLAKQVNWSVSRLAKQCGVSVRALERHFLRSMKKSPKAWLREQRQKLATELLRDGCSVKETAAALGYKHPTHFSREFRKRWGYTPVAKQASTSPTVNCRVLV